MIVRFDKAALLKSQQSKDNAIGVEGDIVDAGGKLSEADKIVISTKQMIAEGGTPAVGISASNSGRGHDPIPPIDNDNGNEAPAFKPTTINGPVEEEPASLEDSDAPEIDTNAVPNPDTIATPTATSPNTVAPATKSS